MGAFRSRPTDTQQGAGFRSTNIPADVAAALFDVNDFEELDEQPAFHDTLASKRYIRSSATDDFERFLIEFTATLLTYIEAQIRRFNVIRVAVYLHPTYAKLEHTGAAPTAPITPVLRTKLVTVLSMQGAQQVVHGIMETLRMRHANFMREKSGLRLESLRIVDVEIARPKHLLTAGSSYTELPKFLSLKKAIVNVKNTDERCFGYAILSALHQATFHVCRPSHYDRFFAEHAELNQLTYPVETDQFERVEQRIGIPFNVFTFYDDQGQARYPLYISNLDSDAAIDLLFWNGHFAWIKSFTRFLGDQNTNGHIRYFCKRCFGRLTTHDALKNHQEFCTAVDGFRQIYTMPEENTKLKFYNVRH